GSCLGPRYRRSKTAIDRDLAGRRQGKLDSILVEEDELYLDCEESDGQEQYTIPKRNRLKDLAAVSFVVRWVKQQFKFPLRNLKFDHFFHNEFVRTHVRCLEAYLDVLWNFGSKINGKLELPFN